MRCTICNKTMSQKISIWVYYCKSCDYWASSLPSNIEFDGEDYFSEEENVISFLDNTRKVNFKIILDLIKKKIDPAKINPTILDVGCATGLFLTMARDAGFQVYGIEPNPNMSKYAAQTGCNVINGYFPESIKNDQKFDVIIFNDVLEHIPELSQIWMGCNRFLSVGGLLVINIPNSNGFFFRISKLLANMSIVWPWERLWQKMFYTPHLHYFNPDSLTLIAAKMGFKPIIKPIPLEAFRTKGLWERISVDGKNNLLLNVIYFSFALVISPITHFFEKDTFFLVFQKESCKNI